MHVIWFMLFFKVTLYYIPLQVNATNIMFSIQNKCNGLSNIVIGIAIQSHHDLQWYMYIVQVHVEKYVHKTMIYQSDLGSAVYINFLNTFHLSYK